MDHGVTHALADHISPLADQYDYILIDCPPNIGTLTFNALHCCTEAIIPVESGVFSLHGLGKQIETIDTVSRLRNHKIPIFTLVTMFDRTPVRSLPWVRTRMPVTSSIPPFHLPGPPISDRIDLTGLRLIKFNSAIHTIIPSGFLISII
jgi:cellulose biosynthesis protein BcsQ